MFKKSLYCFFLFFAAFLSQGLLGQCENSTQHSNVWSDAWLSCETTPNPNTLRGTGHWIQYDFGSGYEFNGSHFWNSNEEGYTHRGFKEVVIDYSNDGSNWTELGIFEFEEATGADDYEGFAGPDFGGIQARYILITMLSTFDEADCTGLAEVKFYVDEIITVTNIETVELEEKTNIPFHIFPNPVEDIIYIQTDQLPTEGNWDSYKVINELGQVVMAQDFSKEINVSHLVSGIYQIMVEDKKGNSSVQQFVKVTK